MGSRARARHLLLASTLALAISPGVTSTAFAAPQKAPPAAPAAPAAAPPTATAATPAPATTPTAATTAASPDDNLAQAKEHYEAGLKLYDTGDYDGARVEFERAYKLAPTYRLLYNLGLVQKQKSDYVGALKNFELYLEEGGTQLPEVRRTQVTDEIAQLKRLVATVIVTTNVPDADVTVDDVPVGKSPLHEPLLVNPGQRKIGASKKGRLPAAKVVDVVSRDQVKIQLDLPESKQLVIIEKSRRVPWIGWGITGALAVTAGITGYVALNASSNLTDTRNAPNADPDRLSTLSSRTRLFGAVADIATLGAVIVGGVSLYYTIKWGKEHDSALEPQAPPPNKAASVKALDPKAFLTPAGVAGTF